MTVARLLSEADSAELTEWMAWHELQREQSDKPPAVEDQLRKVLGAPHGV